MPTPLHSYAEHVALSDRDCMVAAHRGIWKSAPENSLSAIESAIRAGCEVVEIDVRRSADGTFFLLHDETLARMTDDSRPLEAVSNQELSRLLLRNRDGGAHNEITREKLPSLEEVFALTRGNIFVHIDLKHRDEIPDVAACARSMGVEREIDFWGDLKTSADLAWIRKTVIPENILFMAKTRLNSPDVKTQTDLLFNLAPALCEVYFDELEEVKALKDECGKNGTTLWCNTLDDVSCAGFTDTAAMTDPAAVWGRLIDAGISVIQTDEPQALKAFLKVRAEAA